MGLTPQSKLVVYGGVAALVAKFYFHKPVIYAAMVGLATISAVSILTAHNDTVTP